jgi:hypothetical protein
LGEFLQGWLAFTLALLPFLAQFYVSVQTCPKQVFAEIKNAPATLGYHWFAKTTKSRGSGGEPYAKGIEPVQSNSRGNSAYGL